MSLNPPLEPDLAALQGIFNSWRDRSGMSYDELASATGISRRTLLYVGTGKYHGNLTTWLILAKVWDVSLDELLAPVWD